MTHEIIERQKRNLETISEPAKKHHILSKYLIGKELKFKDQDERGIVRLKNVSQDGNKILISASPELELETNEPVSLYVILSKYIQLDCKVLQKRPDSQYVLGVEKIGIASREREHPRYEVPPGAVWITNILTSKATIDANMFIVPTSVKVNFSDYEIKLKNTCDYIKISTFQSNDPDKIRIVKKTQKMLLIEDTQNPQCYQEAITPDFINYEEEIDSDFKSEMRKLKDQKVVSELIVPVIYIDLEEKAIPIGYIHMQSKKDKFDLGKAMEIKTLTFEMVDRIRNSNTVTITERFNVLDISAGGLKVKINHPELNQTLPRLSGFNFDIFFKMQSPMSVFGLIRSIYKDPDGSLILGIQLAGNSARPGEKKRFLENLEILKKNAKRI